MPFYFLFLKFATIHFEKSFHSALKEHIFSSCCAERRSKFCSTIHTSCLCHFLLDAIKYSLLPKEIEMLGFSRSPSLCWLNICGYMTELCSVLPPPVPTSPTAAEGCEGSHWSRSSSSTSSCSSAQCSRWPLVLVVLVCNFVFLIKCRISSVLFSFHKNYIDFFEYMCLRRICYRGKFTMFFNFLNIYFF